MRLFQLSMWTLVHAHVSSWACARFQLSMHSLSGVTENMHASWAYAHFHFKHAHVPIEHVHASSWACTHFQLSMCTLPVGHVHNATWACAQSPQFQTPKQKLGFPFLSPNTPNIQVSLPSALTPQNYRFPSPQLESLQNDPPPPPIPKQYVGFVSLRFTTPQTGFLSTQPKHLKNI